MRIDAHHSWSDRHPLEIFRTILDRNRFEASVAVVAKPAPMPYVLRTDLARPDLARLLDDLRSDANLRGVCHVLEDSSVRQIFPGLFELAHRRLPLDLDVKSEQVLLVAEIAAQYPTLRLAIDHLGRPAVSSGRLEEWARALECAGRHPNVFCKLSGLTTLGTGAWKAVEVRPAVQHALAVFGPARLMFGSDWPNCLPAASWKETLAAFTQSIGAQPIDVREQLLGGTAATFYEIAAREPAERGEHGTGLRVHE